MKRTRKIAALVAAMAMTATMAVPFTAMAASQDVTVYVSTGGTGMNNEGKIPKTDVVEHTYTAYEIFKGENVQTEGADTAEDTSDDAYDFNVTGFGTGVDWTSLLTDNSDFMKLKPDGTKTIADVIAALGASATEAQKAAAIAQVLGENITTASDEADELAKIFEAAKVAAEGTALTTTPVTMTEGYYLITDTYTPATGGSNDALSKFILQVAKKQGDSSITIVPKKSYPTVEKKVKEDDKNVSGKPINDGETNEKWNDVADYDIGEAVPFKLYGTLPATINDYSAYYYKFTDTLGTQFDQPTTLTISIGDKTLTATLNQDAYTVTGDEEGQNNCRVAWDATSHVLTVTFEDIKVYYTPDNEGDIPTDGVITVEYTAVLNDTANIGLPGQENAVNLTYSNNPNYEYTPNTTDDNENTPKDDNGTPGDTTDDQENTDNTPDDKVIVFTYELDVTKIDGVTKQPLRNAVFNLKKGDQFAKIDNNGKFLGWVNAPTDTDGTTSLTSDANGLFKVSGIDDGVYSLVEVTPPSGYNPLTTPIAVTISASTVNDQEWAFTPTAALTGIELNHVEQDAGDEDGNRGHVALDVENNKGTTLPATGGMGTILFYTVGGILVIGAGVVLVTKKRSKKEQ